MKGMRGNDAMHATPEKVKQSQTVSSVSVLMTGTSIHQLTEELMILWENTVTV
jgi:hypothetical protein